MFDRVMNTTPILENIENKQVIFTVTGLTVFLVADFRGHYPC